MWAKEGRVFEELKIAASFLDSRESKGEEYDKHIHRGGSLRANFLGRPW